jgi:hypothetical protein
MLAVMRRRMTEGERQVLARRLRSRAERTTTFLWRFLLTTCAVVLLAVVADLVLASADSEWYARTRWIVLGGAVTGVAVAIVSSREPARREALVRQDLAQGEVEVLDVEARAVWKFVDPKQPDSDYFLDLGEGEVLYLGGEWVYEASFPRAVLAYQELSREEVEAQRVFPCLMVRVERAPRSGVVLRLERRSDAVEPARVLAPADLSCAWWITDRVGPESLRFPGTLGTLAADLARVAEG